MSHSLTKLDMAVSDNDLPWTPSLKDMEAHQNVRHLKIKGACSSWQEYIDTHFELMKEDLICPLRNAIERFKEHKDFDSPGVHFYWKVQMVDIIFMSDICHQLRVQISKNTLNHFENNCALALGTLLVISANDFESFVYAVITKRETDGPEQVTIDVKVIPTEGFMDELLANGLIMAELKTHYTAYSYVLSALKQTKICSRLQDHIINCSPRLKRPVYLKSKSKYDLSCIMKNKMASRIELLGPGSWPNTELTCLNMAQNKAVKQALTKELAIINGLSGTGKTFVCLKIIELLLKNTNHFQSPILVICRTSDCLDRIIEKVITYTALKVVRFGGKNISSALENYSIEKIKKYMNDKYEFSEILESNYWKCSQKLAKLSEEIAECQHRLETLETRIQPPKDLMKHMNKNHRNAVKKSRWSVQSMADWLCGEDYNDKLYNVSYMTTRLYTELSDNTFLPMTENEESKAKQLKLLSANQRLALYKLWIIRFRKQLREKLEDILKEYNSIHNKTYKSDKQRTSEALRSAVVIGMTAVAAAKHSWELRTAKCKIVIIEDAGHLLESQVIASLNQECQHLILIGDQLQSPTCAVSKLKNDHGFGVSLFERLINNEIPYVLLNEQYREICPSISRLIKCIYPKEISIAHYHNLLPTQNKIYGVSKNLFFIDHNHKESKCGLTKKDVYTCEADFVVAISKYLLYHGCPGSKVTILATNVKQMLNIKKKMVNFKNSHSVVVTTVDRYRHRTGIILLSSIRSREEITGGFPADIKLVSLALSKATHGFFVIGDFDGLKSQSKQWFDIIEAATASKSIGTSFPVSNELTVTQAEEVSLYISHKTLQKTSPLISEICLLPPLFSIRDIKKSSFQIKCNYCLLKIRNMDTHKKYKKECAAMIDAVCNNIQNLTYREKQNFQLDLACLLYLVCISELQYIGLRNKTLKAEQRMLIKEWQGKLLEKGADAKVIDNADDFVETLMLSLMTPKHSSSNNIMTTAELVDEINAVLFSEHRQMLCDVLSVLKPCEEVTVKKHFHAESKIKLGKVVHGRRLYWYLADKNINKE